MIVKRTFRLNKKQIKQAFAAWLMLFQKVDLKAGDKITVNFTLGGVTLNVYSEEEID